VIGGRNGKPRYVVTRKENQNGWHWRQIVPHVTLLVALLGSMGWSLASRGLLGSFDIGSAYWAVLYSLLMLGFIRLSWHSAKSVPLRETITGLIPRRRRYRRYRRRRAALARAASHEAGALPAPGAAWSAYARRTPSGVLASLASDARGHRSRGALRQLELRISEWDGLAQEPLAAQLSRESDVIASSALAES
jgi:hypothetical protein